MFCIHPLSIKRPSEFQSNCCELDSEKENRDTRSITTMAPSITRGALIVVEGLDRAGKTTQVQRLHNLLTAQQIPVRNIRFPDRTTAIGQMINSYLQGTTETSDHVIHLLFSANRWELAKSIEESLNSGTTVVVDRYYYSGVVYSSAKDHSDLQLNWAREPEVGLPKPDLTLFLDIAPEIAAKRGGFGEERYENEQMQRRVRQLFYLLIAMEGGEKEDLKIINAGRDLDAVAKDIKTLVTEAMEAVHNGVYGEQVRKVEKWNTLREGSFLSDIQQKYPFLFPSL